MTFRSKLHAGALAVLLAAGMPGAAVRAQETNDACHSAQTANPMPVHVRAPRAVLELRVAATISQKEYGLMCVRALAPHAGMIFVYNDGDNLRDYWMKNTLIPLDMIWVSKNGRVDTVHANVPSTTVNTPDDKIPHRSGVGSYVIELGAGDAKRAGIRPGALLDVSDVPPGKD
jgi:uncharacterized membrane protein (UPF0127 family)